jgi:O-antigen/teichoic acid export membrane protein
MSDYLTILSGTSQNVVGIGVAAVAMFVVQVMMSRTLGADGFGVVTLLTQAAFVASFGMRAGMDMAVLRDVAMEAGLARWERMRAPVARAAAIATVVSALAALVIIAAEDFVLRALSVSPGDYPWAVPAAALGLPFLALTNVWLAATRGLKIMRYTLYVFWAGQNIAWIAFTLILWRVSESATASVLAYSLSWGVAAAAAHYCWVRESRNWEVAGLERGWLSRLVRYAGPRGPAALLAQLLFWTDLFVVTRYVAESEVGIYSAALRAGQIIVLFLTSVNLMFGPYVADLHNRGERKHLDDLYKTLTRWIVAATLPVVLTVVVAPGAVLSVFGRDFSEGQTALLIVAAGMFANILTGSVGFILVMVGRTGWDLAVYASSIALNLVLAFSLCPRYGIEGAAVANAVTLACSNLVRLYLVRRFVHIQPYDARYARVLVPAGAGLLAMLLVHRALDAGYVVDLVATVAVGGIAYCLTYLAVGLTPPERRQAAALIARIRTR